MNFDGDRFDIDEDYKNNWIKQYIKEKVKQQYQTRKENNGNVSPPPLIIETGNSMQVNNLLNLPSSSSSSSSSSISFSRLPSSSSSSSSSSLPSRSSNYSTNFVMFAPVKSAALAYSLQTNLTIDVDNNNEDAIDRLLKVRNGVPMYKDQNSIIYTVLSQLNPKR
jgi:hypothetical protein